MHKNRLCIGIIFIYSGITFLSILLGWDTIKKGIQNDCKIVPVSINISSKKPYVVAVMAIWDEALVLPLAFDSTRSVVDEYVVIHKHSTDNTLEVLRKCEVAWGLRIRYFPSNMTLREARLFAINLTKSYADVYIIQDGDEVFYDEGPTAARNGIDLVWNGPFEVISSKMVYLKHDLSHTYLDTYKPGSVGKWRGHLNNNIILIPHPTIFLNRPEKIVMPADLTLDVPVYNSFEAIYHDPWKFDVSIKHPLREYLRQFFYEWSKEGSINTIETYALHHDKLHADLVRQNMSSSLDETARFYVKHALVGLLALYSEEEWFPYPRAIRKYIDKGLLRGYEGGDLL